MNKRILSFFVFVLIALFFWSSITLSEEYVIDLSVPLEIKVPDNFAIEGNIPEKLEVKIRTTGWEILGIKLFRTPKLTLNFSKPVENLAFNTSTITNEQLHFSTAVRIIEIRPSIINFTFDFPEEKKVKIYPRIIYSLKEGYDIVTPIFIEPETITIRGTKKILSRIDSLPTKLVVLENLSEFTEIETSIIDTLSNLLIYDTKKVKISFDVQQIVDRSFEKVPVELMNTPKEKEIIIFPSLIDLKLRGGINILGSLQTDSIKVYIDYQKYYDKLDKDVEPEFILPYGIKVLEYFPKQFKLIIRK